MVGHGDLHEAAARAMGRSLELQIRTGQVLAEAHRTLELAATDRVGPGRLQELTQEGDGLRRAMERRAVIEQAKGIIIEAMRCDADRAFEVLVRQSQHENRKLAEVAEE